MIHKLDFHINDLELMKKYPKDLFYKGNTKLLKEKKIAVVGSRKPNKYARELTTKLVARLADSGVCIVSGGAIGVDAIAHKAAGAKKTIMVAATGLDKRYPAINKNLIREIENEGLVLSQFNAGTPSTRYNFVLRNELIVALGEVLIVAYADESSGTMRSVAYALEMGKKIYVLPHRVGESQGTNRLLMEKNAEAIYDIDHFVSQFCGVELKLEKSNDPFFDFCQQYPNYNDVYAKFPNRLFEEELLGNISVKNGMITVLT